MVATVAGGLFPGARKIRLCAAVDFVTQKNNSEFLAM
jgi:hypothetical protein